MAPDFADLSAYLDGELTSMQRRAVEAHLAADPEYAREFERLERVHTMVTLCIEQPGFHAQLMQRVQEEEYRITNRSRSMRYAVVALAAMLVLVAGIVLYSMRPHGQPEIQTARLTPAVAPAQSPEPPSTPSVIAVEQPGTTEPKEPSPPATETPMEVTKLPLKLIGTTTGTTPSAIITVEAEGSSKSNTYGIGDTIMEGATVATIEQGKVTVDFHGQQIVLAQATEPEGPSVDLSGLWIAQALLNGQPLQEPVEVYLLQQGNTLVAKAGNPLNASGTLIGHHLHATVSERDSKPVEIDGEFNQEWTVLTGPLVREDLDDANSVPAGEISFRLTKVPQEQVASKELFEKRLNEVKKMWSILNDYAKRNNRALPVTLNDLVPACVPDLEAFANTETRAVDYRYVKPVAPGRLPTYDETDASLSIPARLMQWEQRLKAAGRDSALRANQPPLLVAYKDPAMKFQATLGGGVSLVHDPTVLLGAGDNSPESVARLSTMRTSCQNNLKQFGLVIYMFKDAHWGYTPPGWLSCIPECLSDPSILTSPKDAPGTDSYLYLYPALNLQEAAQQALGETDSANPAVVAKYLSQLPLLTNKTDFPGPDAGRNVLFADGHVAYMRTDVWRERILPHVGQH